jgi:hypothetical protein
VSLSLSLSIFSAPYVDSPRVKALQRVARRGTARRLIERATKLWQFAGRNTGRDDGLYSEPRCKTSSVGCALRERQMAPHDSSLILWFQRRSKSSLTVVGKIRSQALQAAVPAQSIRKKGIFHIATIKIGRALITSQDLSQYYGCSAIDLTASQLDLEVSCRKGAMRTAVICIQRDQVMQ